ncbi:MAG TPA: tetratricopeptide repeat protein [Candidatus Dormibacteraeota bacterium]|nr:tetratricopeptide repeat protein [Candidatus Dormibacteraeota bacterium]
MTHAGEDQVSTRRRGRRHGVEIRPGSVKEARTKAGLSLGQVARADISRTAIYFVETGKAKPSQETLELIASRTGQPIDFFLTGAGSADRHPALRIAEMERLLATGDNAAVAAAAESALAQGYDPESTALIKLLASMAWLRLAKPVLGRRLAVEARTYFEKSGDLERVAEALGQEAQAAGLMQDSSAVQIAEGALATCRSLKPVPQLLEARLLRVLGHQLLTSERWAEAIACYDEAIATGDAVQDLQQLSLLYSGMSLAHQELGEINQATRYAQKALTIHETLQDRISQARSLNNLGWMLVKLGDFAAARTHLDRALRIFEEQHVEVGRAEFLMSLATLEMEEGRLETAAATARRSLELSTGLGEVASAAEGYVLIGQIASRRGKAADADEAFAQALVFAERAGASRLSRVHEAYADVLESRGDLIGANRHLKQALTARRPASAAMGAREATA